MQREGEGLGDVRAYGMLFSRDPKLLGFPSISAHDEARAMQQFAEFFKSLPPWASGAAAGFISGMITSLIAPFVGWHIEKKRLLHAGRKEFIASARAELAKLKSEGDFEGSELYSRLRPHFSERTIAARNKESTVVIKSGRRTRVYSYIESVCDDVAALEQKWGLV